jgi:hypothetical protein
LPGWEGGVGLGLGAGDSSGIRHYGTMQEKVGYIKQVVLGFQFTDSDTIAAVREMKDNAIAAQDRSSATPENPKIASIKLIKRNNKASPNIASLLFCASKYEKRS